MGSTLVFQHHLNDFSPFVAEFQNSFVVRSSGSRFVHIIHETVILSFGNRLDVIRA